MSDGQNDAFKTITDELLELEGDFDAEMDGLRERQRAALERLEQAIANVKASKDTENDNGDGV